MVCTENHLHPTIKMKRPYLLIAGDNYYPSGGTDDWIDCYETLEEAKAQVEANEYPIYFTKGKMKGKLKQTHVTYKIKNNKYGDDHEFDWYEIVNLEWWSER